MDSIARFFKKLEMLLRRERFNSELEEEMTFHREQKERELRDTGMAPGAVHHAAMREFGNGTRLKEQRFTDSVSAPLFGLASGRVCSDGLAAGRGGTLWGDCVFGEPENSRDRRENGAGRATEFCVSDDFERGRVADWRWNLCAPGMFSGRGDTAAEAAVRHPLVGYAYAGCCRSGAWCFGAAGELFSGAKSSFSESRGGFAGGVGWSVRADH